MGGGRLSRGDPTAAWHLSRADPLIGVMVSNFRSAERAIQNQIEARRVGLGGHGCPGGGTPGSVLGYHVLVKVAYFRMVLTIDLGHKSYISLLSLPFPTKNNLSLQMGSGKEKESRDHVIVSSGW